MKKLEKYTVTVTKTVTEVWEVEATDTISARILYENGKAIKVSETNDSERTETKPSN